MKKLIILVVALCLTLTGCTKEMPRGFEEGFSEFNQQGDMHITVMGNILGRCTLIEFEGDEAILTDCGLSEDFSYIYEYLRRKGIKRLKYIILTSALEESVGGFDKIMANFDVSMIFLSEDISGSPLGERLVSVAGTYNAGISFVSSGSKIYDFGSWGIDVISNEKYVDESEVCSLCLYVAHQNTRVLLEGVTSAEIQAKLATELKGLISCDALISPGLTKERSGYFAEETNPSYLVLFSLGGEYPEGNVYGHYTDSAILSTTANGTIIIKSDGENISISCER